jgi:EAL domain-containing protein (putative c-di-GMP-specific phosphodiesterase class I)/GGDEF domain-containing protein
MADHALQHLLPELHMLVRRDGVLLDCLGGRGVAGLMPPGSCIGQPLECGWPEQVSTIVRQLVRRAIGSRSGTEARFVVENRAYDIRVTAQGPDRAICVVSAAVKEAGPDTTDCTPAPVARRLERRGFLRRFRESMADATLREKPTAVAVIELEGVRDVARVMDARVCEQVIRAAVERVSGPAEPDCGERLWYAGQLSEDALAVVIASDDRETIEACVTDLCEKLRTPVSIGSAALQLTPHAGVAILGRDGTSPNAILDHARAAASEMRRAGSERVCFFSDTLQLRSLARLDIAQELNEAISRGDVRLRYVGRHDLATGNLVCHVGYLRWVHPLRGEVRPAEFVGVAEATGLAVSLSRSAMSSLHEDFATLLSQSPKHVRISFGALRHHVLHRDFATDIAGLLADSGVPPDYLELRVSERTFISVEPATLRALSSMGVQLVVDEVARGLTSFERMAQSPLVGLQLDRSWTSALHRDQAALRVCGAGISVATALGLTPIATGVDDVHKQRALLRLGCQQGIGDLYSSGSTAVCSQSVTEVSERTASC